MTSIFFPFSAGWTLLSRVYCLPSTKSAELALENASAASVPTTSMASLFIATPARGRYLTPLGPWPPTGVPAGGRTRALGALGILDHRTVEPELGTSGFDVAVIKNAYRPRGSRSGSSGDAVWWTRANRR